MAKITPQQFVDKLYPYAMNIQDKTDIPAIAIIAQAALESGWGEKAIGNNIFGIKFTKGDNGFQKVLTTEYSSSPNEFKGSDIKSIFYDRETNKYKYSIYQYFADYKTIEEGLLAHANLLISERYKEALLWNHSPKRFLIKIWRLGYATDPNYGSKICQMVDSVNKRIWKH